MIRLRVLGTPLLDIPNGPADQLSFQPKRLALLTFLAAAGFRPVSRDALIGLFWRDRAEERARGCLRQALHFLRSTLGAGIFHRSAPDYVCLARDAVWCDAVEFEDRLRLGDPAGALALYEGDFLSGLSLPDAPDFDHWVLTLRERLRSAAAFAATSAAEEEIARNNFRGALYWATRAEMVAPSSEKIAQLMISLHDRLGNPAEAIAKFEEFSSWLRTEHGIKPSGEMVSLVRVIKRRESGRGDESGRELVLSQAGAAILARVTEASPAIPVILPALEPATHGGREDVCSTLIEGASDIIYATDLEGRLVFTNPAATRLLGFSAQELRAMNLFELVRDDYRDAAVEFYLRQVRERIESTYHEAPVLDIEGRSVWLGNSAHLAKRSGRVVGFNGIARDVTAKRQADAINHRLALKDIVSGLYNREAFAVVAENRMAAAAETGMSVCFLLLTLDNYDEIERSHGRSEAQRALSLGGQVLRDTFGQADFVARLSDNRFGIVTSAHPAKIAEVLETKLQANTRRRMSQGELAFDIRFTPELVEDVDRLMA